MVARALPRVARALRADSAEPEPAFPPCACGRRAPRGPELECRYCGRPLREVRPRPRVPPQARGGLWRSRAVGALVFAAFFLAFAVPTRAFGRSGVLAVLVLATPSALAGSALVAMLATRRRRT